LLTAVHQDTKGDEAFGFDANGQPIMKQALPTQIHALPTSITQIACGANHALALDTNGTVWTWGCSEQNLLGRSLVGRLDAMR
jgi:regulator of chromosome condensation